MRRKRPVAITRIAHGFMLIEMLIVLGLLAVVALMAGQLFRVTGQISRESAQRQIRESQLDQAMQQLRADVWQASQIELRDPHSIRLHTPDGQEIEWDMTATLSRKSFALLTDQSEQRWSDLGADVTFAARGPGLVITVSRGPEVDGEFVLVSQSMLLSGRTQ